MPLGAINRLDTRHLGSATICHGFRRAEKRNVLASGRLLGGVVPHKPRCMDVMPVCGTHETTNGRVGISCSC